MKMIPRLRHFDPRRMAAIVVAVISLSGPALSARAGISFIDLFRNDAYTQTGDGASLSSNGSFLTTNLFSTGAGDYTSVQAAFDGPASPVTLAASTTNSTLYSYGTGFYPSRAAMNADFPVGTYMYAAMNGSATDVASIVYSGDAYALSLPYLAGGDFSALQGMTAASAFDFHFSAFTPDPSTNEADLFFAIFDANTGAVVFDAGFQPSATAGLTLPANTLQPGNQYAYELIFSDRRTVSSPGAEFDAQVGNDLRTSGIFATAVPEPSSWLLLAMGGAGFVGRRWAKRRRALRVFAS